MTEKLSEENRQLMIKKATLPDHITLLTRTYGRGTDFKSQNRKVNNNGGIHVIQTFLSEELSEETQIKGRTARQGQEGSYSMVLLIDDLEKFAILKDDADKMKADGNLYDDLNEKRCKYFEKLSAETNEYVKQAKKKHDDSLTFLKNIEAKDISAVKAFLIDQNRGYMPSGRSKTLVMMDATGSMENTLQKAKNTVEIMFERVCNVMIDRGLSPESFQIQFCVYRNYSSLVSKILQVSPWAIKPDVLQTFMQEIRPEGGQGNEAIEVAFWHANEENDREQICQVILIGDAAPNTQRDIDINRGYREDYWKETKFKNVQHYSVEMQKLISNGIPVHAFYVLKYAKESFEEISSQTGGKSGFLDIDSDLGATTLTDIVSTEVLRKAGGEEAVDRYMQLYPPSFAS